MFQFLLFSKYLIYTSSNKEAIIGEVSYSTYIYNINVILRPYEFNQRIKITRSFIATSQKLTRFVVLKKLKAK